MSCKKSISKVLVLFLTLSIVLGFTEKKVYADAYKVVTIGADLNQSQKEDMLKYFKVKKEEVNLLEVTKEEEDKYLSGIATQKEIGTRSISCSYVEPTNKGGINVETHNIYWVTESMIKNALITAGIENAEVKAAAPFNVSGTAALTGILKGFENSKGGKKIDENKKKAANEEIMLTGKLGDKIGQDEAASLINEIKKEVVKERPETQKEIENIVVNIVNNYNQSLSKEDIEKITALMDKINSLDLDFDKIKSQLNDVTKQLQGVLTSEEAKGFFAKLFEAIKNLITSIFGG
ncbi:DUF1002 domain-containing protein [Clostridium cochlearium]|jgi:uncharacterized protein YpuA (DUF1002 family)|uniref:Extracellular protein n=1 Tax=Clostridium cochlearium TaxID=1494 RepID=A0A240A833_CLOCO|nr:DUF1002 domain-containing protein [Clostridium cochlearium]MBV1820172.1 DUF1002 domain-containing protein [Bacteroidales bacterium MSK.15.36]NSJ91778.1 DUF1002 domain-containing protein [Coprococcus sp. MSK.21.13]MBE6064529.1 DUF1002 domain-containing protein [Clostridium cochlearium]MCG4570767.1 DUF1002 domain-containing protein [Clostridium cochlearium]MCG4580241.1 DUF1002 domain-containing protein [Clostridium cochlearium]